MKMEIEIAKDSINDAIKNRRIAGHYPDKGLDMALLIKSHTELLGACTALLWAIEYGEISRSIQIAKQALTNAKELK